MTRWITVAQPSAELEPEMAEPEVQEDGTEVTRFRTRFGKRYARVVEASGFVYWMQEVEQ